MFICYDMLGYIALQTNNIEDVITYAKKQFPKLSHRKIINFRNLLKNPKNRFVDIYHYEHGFNVERK